MMDVSVSIRFLLLFGGDKVTLMGTNQDGRNAPQRSGMTPHSKGSDKNPEALGVDYTQWTTEQLEEYVLLHAKVVESTARKMTVAYVTKHLLDENHENRPRPKHIRAHAGVRRPLCISFTDAPGIWWFVAHHHKHGMGVWLRDSIHGFLLLVPSGDDEHWTVKTTPVSKMMTPASQKWLSLKERLSEIQAHLIARIRAEYEEEQEHEKNVEVVTNNFNKANLKGANLKGADLKGAPVPSHQQMFEAMNHENLMRLRTYLEITESPTKGRGRPPKSAYRAQVRKHIEDHNLWHVMDKSF
jgi:hypothetical protein